MQTSLYNMSSVRTSLVFPGVTLTSVSANLCFQLHNTCVRTSWVFPGVTLVSAVQIGKCSPWDLPASAPALACLPSSCLTLQLWAQCNTTQCSESYNTELNTFRYWAQCSTTKTQYSRIHALFHFLAAWLSTVWTAVYWSTWLLHVR